MSANGSTKVEIFAGWKDLQGLETFAGWKHLAGREGGLPPLRLMSLQLWIHLSLLIQHHSTFYQRLICADFWLFVLP
jgi:hypothetical protein